LFENLELYPFWVSFKLATVTTFILLFFSIPFSWFLSQTKSRIKPFLEALTALPIVLPPSVLGFYILIMLSPNSFLGEFIKDFFGVELLFSFSGLVFASVFYSLPFMVQPLQSGFQSLDKYMLEASYISGKGQIETLFRVALPNIRPALITAIVVTFAHTIGEFGVVLMIGGSIPHETKVASVAIYEFVEIMDYNSAHFYSFIMLLLSFSTLFVVYFFNMKKS
jgi:molybdate transport system permease protein